MGVIDIQRVQALAKDALGLFCWRRPIEANIQLLHVPAPMAAVSGEPLLQGGQKQAGSWQDTHEVREYQPGDSLRWIHHKLSYKSGRLMVRAFENDTHPHVILFLDLSASLTQNEATIALYQGACAALLKDGVRCTIRWYSEERSCSCSVSESIPASCIAPSDPRCAVRTQCPHPTAGKIAGRRALSAGTIGR